MPFVREESSYLVTIVVTTLQFACKWKRATRWEDYHVNQMFQLGVENHFHLFDIVSARPKKFVLFDRAGHIPFVCLMAATLDAEQQALIHCQAKDMAHLQNLSRMINESHLVQDTGTDLPHRRHYSIVQLVC